MSLRHADLEVEIPEVEKDFRGFFLFGEFNYIGTNHNFCFGVHKQIQRIGIVTNIDKSKPSSCRLSV
jgi:hypothetical protein